MSIHGRIRVCVSLVDPDGSSHAKLFLSKDLGLLAAECLRHQRQSPSMRDWLSRNVARYAGHGGLAEADLLSYIFFDRCYAERLIQLGGRDATAAADGLVEFLS